MELKWLSGVNLPVSAVIVAVDGDYTIVDATERFCEKSGYNKESLLELTGLKQKSRMADGDYDLFISRIKQVANGGDCEDFALRLTLMNGKYIWVNIKVRFFQEIESIKYVMIMFTDITKQKQLENKVTLLTEQYRIAGEVAGELLFDLDVIEWKLFQSKSVYELFGENKEAGYEDFFEVVKLRVHPLDRDNLEKSMQDATCEEIKSSVDYRLNVKSLNEVPEYVWFRTYYRSILDKEGRIIRVVGRTYNIDEDKILEDEVKKDALTGVLNAGEAKKEVKEYIEEHPKGKAVLFIIDVDNFKEINDTFGHTYGDNVIVETANLIKEQFREEDIVGRIGGDEFMVLMKSVPVSKAKERAKELCRIMERAYTGGTVTRYISASVGMAVLGKDGNDFKSLFEKADHAMYRAKTAGKNGFEFATNTDIGPLHSVKKKDEMRNVFVQEDKDFLMFAVSLMSHARNIDGSLNMLLKRIAARFNLSLVALFEDIPKQNSMVLTNYYSDIFSFYDRMVFDKQGQILDKIEVGKVTVISDQTEVDSTAEFVESNERKIIGMPGMSEVAGRYEYVGNRTGTIFFLSTDENRVWEKSELSLMEELTRIISIFVSLRFRMDEGKAEVRRIQRRDQLTGLYNLEAFKVKAKTILKKAKKNKKYAIAYLDIDNFGYVNDNYGYQVGDNALKMMADDIKTLDNFDVGCRLYSDFFLVLVEADSVEDIKESLLKQHKKFTNMQNHQYPSGCMSITSGVYLFDENDDDVDMAVENATLAWKIAKNERKHDIVFFKPEYRTNRTKEQQIIGEFYEALYRDDFLVYLQPKFVLGQGNVYGAEALVRWKLPDGTIVAPDKFMGPIEKIGYIRELDFYVFEELLKTMSKWKKQGRENIVVSTNFSGLHFEGDGESFINRISYVLSKYDVEPKYLEIEITEGVMVRNIEVLRKCIDKLHAIGFRVAIDDFGTGYSSLSVLMDIPADVVKMDKSFLDGKITEKMEQMLVEIGTMVKVAGKENIFEGVETREQEEFLMKCGFQYGQGYLCDKPIRVSNFEKKYLPKKVV